jgi:hypothetical protein
MTNYSMNQPIRLALIGDNFCRTNKQSPTQTFVTILKLHYGANLQVVVEGRAGGTSIAGQIEDMDLAQQRGADVQIIFHEPQNDRAQKVYQAEQEMLGQKARHTGVHTWHFCDRKSANAQLRQPQDYEVMNYPHDWFTEYRHCVPYTESANGVDSVGNQKIARKIIGIIDAYSKSLANN